jgi:flagellar hook assembly protein FlgD
MRNIDFRADADISAVSNSFVLTDVSNVSVRIYDENKRLVRTLTSSWMLAGQKDLLWDRRSDEGTQVPAGTYRYEIGAASAYSGEPTISNTRFYLPLYYHEDCGSAHRVDDAHLVQGSVVAWGDSPSQTASEHASSVQYRFTGLKPAGEYEVAAEFAAGDGVQRLQELTASNLPPTGSGQANVRLGEPVRVAGKPTVTAFIKLPKDSYASGDVTISVNKLGEASAIVTQLWLKETGVGFTPQPIATIPTKYLLEQNYPNPFNPTTTIRYAIPNDGFVTLKVYSITGQEIATLVNEPRTAGKYETTFDAKNTLGTSLASGIYFYRVSVKGPSGKAGSYTETKKMILVK